MSSAIHIHQNIPGWLPEGAQHYLAHTEAGLSIRALAREAGCHASTILRQIRKVETRRDDPLVDDALRKIGAQLGTRRTYSELQSHRKERAMPAKPLKAPGLDAEPQKSDLIRVLRRLCERGAVLAVAADMEKAVIVRESADGASQRTAIVERSVAEALALREWIATAQQGRITRYRITQAGRAGLEGLLEDAPEQIHGFAEAQAPFGDARRVWGEKDLEDPDTGRVRRMRYNLAESPLTALARRRDKDGVPFLPDALVSAGERLREDFELAQMGPSVAQNWDRFLTGGARGGFSGDSPIGTGPAAARARVASALETLGPGLGDVALRCCCYLEGLETAEKKLGWSARSGKIVLRIALQQLKRHYEDINAKGGGLIG